MKNKRIAVFCGGNPGIPAEENLALAYLLGKLLAQNNYALVSGAGSGLMNEICKGSYENGGHVIGICFNVREGQSTYLSEHEIHTQLVPRQQRILELGDAYLALPGGVGTFYEALEVAARKKAKEIPYEKPMILVGNYWNNLYKFLQDAKEADFIPEPLADLITYSSTPEDTITSLNEYFQNNQEVEL